MIPFWKGFCLALGLCLAFGSARAGEVDHSLLPAWATPHAQAVAALPEPRGADAWVLLDRTEIAYAGDGEVRVRHLRLVKVLTERGLREGTFVLSGLGGKTSTVKKLRGWNLRPGGDLERMDQDSVVTVDSDSEDTLTTGTLTAASVPRVVKGSLVAFESLQVFRHPMGPVDEVYLLGRHPVRRWELQVAKKEGWFTNLRQVNVRMEKRHFSPWVVVSRAVPGESIQADDLPPLPRGETAQPHLRNLLPKVVVSFLDPELKSAPSCESWDTLATWVWNTYGTRAYADPLPGGEVKDPRTCLESAHRWMSRELTYRQVYLSPDRGWVPESAAETIRKRYGDCKDLATCFMAQLKHGGLSGFPALARIGEGRVEADEPVSPFCFNHAIAAVRLDQSLGLNAEVQTPKGRFLLVDMTSRTTPLGYLGTAHHRGRVLICTDSGGIWADIPDEAILRTKVEVRLEATADAQGALTGTLRFRESGDAGLRLARIHLGESGLRAHLLREVLDLPPTGKLDLLPPSDPFDLAKPFEVSIRFSHPTGLNLSGKEATLMRWGLPGLPPVLQRAGVPRAFPIEVEASSSIDYEAIIRAPWALRPELGALDLETALRKVSWKAESSVQDQGSILRLSFRQSRKPYFADHAMREQGVTAWKEDRAGLKRILDDGLVFTRLP